MLCSDELIVEAIIKIKNMRNTTEKPFNFTSPEPSPEPVVLAELLGQIRETIQNHIVIQPEAATALAVWVVHTYVFKARDAVAYVAIDSPEKRCGKTTLVSVLAGLAAKSLVASNITVGALFRAIDQFGPTLLIDEADTYLSHNSAMRGILNCGNTWRTAYVIRLQSEPGEEYEMPDGAENPPAKSRPAGRKGKLIAFNCYCPKVVAMIGKVPDTIADRSIVVRMERKMVTEKCLPLTEFHPEEMQRKCARFARDQEAQVKAAAMERIAGLNDRAADTYEPLAVLARLAGPVWLERLSQAAVKLAGEEINGMQGAGFLLDMLELMVGEDGAKIFSSDLCHRLKGGEGWQPSLYFANRAINEVEIAKALGNYGIKPKTIRIGTRTARGYQGRDFKYALNRYVPQDAIDKRLQEMRETAQMNKEAQAEWYKARQEERVQHAEDMDEINNGRGAEMIAEKKEHLQEMRSERKFLKQIGK